MSFKGVVRDLLPPALHRGLRRLAGLPRLPKYAEGYVGTYPSFEAAEKAAVAYFVPERSGNPAGVLRQIISAPPIQRFDERFLQVHSAMAIVAAAENKTKLSVLDVGGGIGAYAKAIKQLMPNISFDWTVLELEEIASPCSTVAGAPCSFVSEPPDGGFDIVLISGTLQYLPPKALRPLAAKARWLILNRLPVIDGDADKTTLQIIPKHLGGGAYPCWLFSESRIRNDVAGLGTVITEWTTTADAGLHAMVTARPLGLLVRLN